MMLNRRKRKSEEREWKWEKSKIERVSEFRYLGTWATPSTREPRPTLRINLNEHPIQNHIISYTTYALRGFRIDL
jgi:hypothetical protein